MLSLTHMHHKPRKMYTNHHWLLDPQDKSFFSPRFIMVVAFSNVETGLWPSGPPSLPLVPREVTDCLGNSGISCNIICLNESTAPSSIKTSRSASWNTGFPKMLVDFKTIIGVLERYILGKSMKRQFTR